MRVGNVIRIDAGPGWHERRQEECVTADEIAEAAAGNAPLNLNALCIALLAYIGAMALAMVVAYVFIRLFLRAL